MGCGSSQAATVVPQETNENGINEASENGKKYRKSRTALTYYAYNFAAIFYFERL